MDIKYSEKESLKKSFFLFFIIMELFLLFIFYNYYRIEEEHLNEQILLEMKNYSFFFDDDRFDIDITPKTKDSKLYELYMDKDSLYMLAPMEKDSKDLLKIYYPKSLYNPQLNSIREMILYQALFLSFIAALISLIFSLYSLYPLRRSLQLLEEFIKDIIHDLNTPISSILINLKMMDQKNDEVKSIEISAKTISMLHKNLDSYLKDIPINSEMFDLKKIVEEQISFFRSQYDYLEWRVDIQKCMIKSDKNAITRIIYNLLSNACKYNTSDGFIEVILDDKILSIKNSSYGIKNPDKIFDRFYKESDRGMGIGLHIVDKLCSEIGIKKDMIVEDKDVVKFTLYFEEILSS